MTELKGFIRRNTTLFYRDKGVFFTSLITPVILLVLYISFLGNVYKQTFTESLGGMHLPQSITNGLVASQLVSSLLAVCCVTVPFCANMLMVADKASGIINYIRVTPAKASTIALGYYISAFISSICIGMITLCAGLAYIATQGLYFSALDVLMLFADMIILVAFGVSLSSLINFFLSTQGQISAVGTIVSAGYGFLCGAYMPISNFSQGLANALAFLPGTHATALLREHSMRGVFEEMKNSGVDEKTVSGIHDAVDCTLYLNGNAIPVWVNYTVMLTAVFVITAVYIILNKRKIK